MAAHFLPSAARPVPGAAFAMKTLGITKGVRTEYDHYMLQLHDGAKLDTRYQENCSRTPVSLPAGATWFVYTDLVSHAVLSGQYVLEQTVHVPVAAMQDPALSPLRMLEKAIGRDLA